MYIWFTSIKIDKHMLLDTLTVFLSTKLCRQWSWLSPILAWSTKTNIHCKYIRSHVACKHTILVSIFVTILFNSTSSVFLFIFVYGMYMEDCSQLHSTIDTDIVVNPFIYPCRDSGQYCSREPFLCLLIQRTCMEPMLTRSVVLSIMQ